MKPFSFLPKRGTKYIRLSPHQCQGCWECVQVCPEEVLVKSHRPRHAHVHIKDSQACTGCKKCVRACAYGAIEYTYVPGAASSRQKPRPKETA